MGMDLEPIAPEKEYPVRGDAEKGEFRSGKEGKPVWGRYNNNGWWNLRESLKEAGLQEADELPGSNDGDEISAEVCKKIADLIENHPALAWCDRRDVVEWRYCGGFKVW